MDTENGLIGDVWNNVKGCLISKKIGDKNVLSILIIDLDDIKEGNIHNGVKGSDIVG